MGNRVMLNVIASGISSDQNRHAPQKQYVTKKNEVALRGSQVELFCIFGGTLVQYFVLYFALNLKLVIFFLF